jgi:hypothetical protein
MDYELMLLLQQQQQQSCDMSWFRFQIETYPYPNLKILRSK